MILPKYYCEECKSFKTRREVEMGFVTCWEHVKVLRCKGCHEPIITSKSALEEVMKDYFVWKEEKRKQRKIKLRTEHSR